MLLAIWTAWISTGLEAKLGKPFTALEDTYKRGNIDALAAQMISVKPTNDDERAMVDYYNAMLKTKLSEQVMLLDQITLKYPNTVYGNKARLERAKQFVLDRDYAKAKEQLQKITSTEVMERYYWLAVCADASNDYEGVISNAETYLRMEPKGDMAQEAYYLMADSYIAKSQYQSALNTLNKITSTDDTQYYEYMLGYCYQMLKNPTEATKHYKAAIEVNRLGQFAYSAEDRLFELKQAYGSKVDLSFLFPYTELEIPVAPEAEAPAAVVPVARDPIPDTPLKLSARPLNGKYIQTGCFKVEANASSLAFNIRKLNLPANYYYDKKKDWVVISGPYSNDKDAEQALLELKAGHIDGFFVNMK